MLFVIIIVGTLLALFVLRLIFFRGPISEHVSEPPEGILDMHCHTAGIGAGGSEAWISDELRKSWKFGLYLKVFGSNVEEVNEEGDQILMEVIASSIRDSVHVDGAVTVSYTHLRAHET